MKHFIIIILTLFSSALFAQKTVKGKVVDASTNSPLLGANISFNGSTASTDKDGMFTVDCSKSSTITISFIGYETVKYNIKNCNDDIKISLTPKASNLDEVEITATSTQNKALLYQPASISKLGTTELKRGSGLFLDDAINSNVPGVSMQRRAVSSGQQFNIRGYGNGTRGKAGVSSNFDTQGSKVYLNGIPVTDAEGITVLDDIDYGSIGNVEVTKGPSGTLYGLAIAGVVNLNTIKPEKGKTSIGQDILVGNYGLQRYTTHFQMGGDHASLLINYGHQKSDGFTVHNASKKDFVNVAGEFQPNSKETVTLYGGYSNSYDERSGELTIGQYDTVNFAGNIEYIKRNGHSNVYTMRAGVGHTYNFNSNISNTTTVFGTGFNSNASSAAGWTDKAATNFGLRSTLNTKFSFKNNISLSGITGVETQRQNASTIGYGMIDPQGSAHASAWQLGDPYFVIGVYPATPAPVNQSGITSDIYTTTSNTSLFTEWTVALPMDISVTAGVGVSSMKLKLEDRFYSLNIPNKLRNFDTAYKGLVSPHFAINKVFSKQFSAYFSYSKGYRAPTSSLIFIPAVAGSTAANTYNGDLNRDLKPEIGNQFEIGTKGELLKSRLTYQVAFFDAIFSNKMTAVAVPNPANNTTLFTYTVNGGKQDDKGIEALIKYTVIKSDKGFVSAVTPFFNLAYSDFKYKDFAFHTIVSNKDSATSYSGQPVAGVAKIVTNLGVDVTTKPGLYANMAWFYKDKMPITSTGLATFGTVNLPYHASSYSLLNAKVGFRHTFATHFDIDAYFAVTNITNTKYPIMVFANQLPDAYMVGAPKANYFGGLNLKYIF